MRLEHHLVGRYVRYISPHIILLLLFISKYRIRISKLFKPYGLAGDRDPDVCETNRPLVSSELTCLSPALSSPNTTYCISRPNKISKQKARLIRDCKEKTNKLK